MKNSNSFQRGSDRGGRRLVLDRRKANNSAHVPGRRSGKDCRSKPVRRTRNEPERVIYLRRDMDGYVEFLRTQEGMLSGLIFGFSFWALVISFVVFKFWF